jgi:divalent metal cation (Fe/Co/Zn/Cd) transporter
VTIGWTAVEAVVALASGVAANSVALVSFGLDSIVELSSALVIVWLLASRGQSEEANERAEARAVRLIALSFFVIAAYVTVDALGRLLGVGDRPEQSMVGLVLVALSLVVMPSIAWAKRRVAAGLGSVALRADAGETLVCAYLSAVVLVGLAANSLAGWWWMDPLAALAVAGLALKEGRQAWISGDLCQGAREVDRFLCAQICCPDCPGLLTASHPSPTAVGEGWLLAGFGDRAIPLSR